MRSVGIKVLKNKLSEYVRLAADGETILVTDRDRVVAELGPPAAGRADPRADARIARAVKNGWISPADPALGPPPPGKPALTMDELLAELERDREDRF